MSRFRRLVAVTACALPLSQLGHALASALRGHGAVQPGPAHAYFTADLTASAAIVSAAAIAAAIALAAARALRGRPLVPARRSAWPLLWTLLALAALQLEIFLLQELAEGSTTGDVAWRGLIGQLPVAALAALVIQWLSGRLGPAARELRERHRFRLLALAPVPQAFAAVVQALAAGGPFRFSDPRGPPALLLPRAV